MPNSLDGDVSIEKLPIALPARRINDKQAATLADGRGLLVEAPNASEKLKGEH